jgi:two-component system, chemotaxis family, chemotaxis protein CheY
MKRILVVDDEPTICEVVADTLRDAGYLVDTALNGADALRLMRRSVPQALVLDVMMPRLGAHGLVELMRLSPRLASVPVMIVSASYAADETARSLGARAYLAKPFELDDLVAMVGRVVGGPLTMPGASSYSEPLGDVL